MNTPTVTLIVAGADNGVIGPDNPAQTTATRRRGPGGRGGGRGLTRSLLVPARPARLGATPPPTADAGLRGRGHTLGQAGLAGPLDRLDQFGHRVGLAQVAYGRHALLGQHSVVVRHAGRQHPEHRRVHDAGVAGVVHDEDLAPGADRVQLARGQVPAERPLVVPGDVHPVAGRALLRGLTDDLQHVGDAIGGRHARHSGAQPGPGQVDVRVHEAGQHGRPVQVDGPAGR